MTKPRITLFFLFSLLCSGCNTRVSEHIEPRICYQLQDQSFSRLQSAFSPLTPEDRATDWGKEMTIAHAFALDLDLYRAISTYKRAEILLPLNFPKRRQEIQYDILLCYYLGKRYEEAIEFFEKSELERVDKAFSAYHDLLLIVSECYREIHKEEREERMHELLQRSFPETAEQLKVSLALRSADLIALGELNEVLPRPSYLDAPLSAYEVEKKSVGTAQFLNAVLPGAGYLYLGQKKSACTAFLLNGLFIAAAAHFFHHHHLAAGIITTSFEAGWYFGGIYGAGEEANYFNEHLYEEKMSPILHNQNLFPIHLLRYAF